MRTIRFEPSPNKRRPLAQVLAVSLLGAAALAVWGASGGRPEAASALAADGANSQPAQRYRVFVALENAGAVGVLSGPPWRVAGRISVPGGPHNLEASPDGRYVAVSSPPSDRVTIIATASRTVVGTATIVGSPHDIAFTPDSTHLWVTAEHAQQLVELSLPGARVVRSIATPGSPHDLAISPSGGQLWVTIDGSASIPIYSPASGRRIGTATPGGAPHDIAFTPDGSQVWLSNFSSPLLTVISVHSRQRLATIRGGSEPHHFAFGLGCLWASDNGGGTLVRIDPIRRRVLSRTPVGPAPHHPTVAGSQVLVAVHATGRVAIVSRTGALIGTLAVGAGPHGIAAVPPTTPIGANCE